MKGIFMKGRTNPLSIVPILISVAVLALADPCFSTTSAERDTLRGVEALNVLAKVRLGDEGARALGITDAQLKTDTEKTLEEAGIKVAGNVRPYLLLVVSVISISHPTVDGILAYVYTAQLKFRQGGVIDSTGERANVTTWDETRFGATTPATYLDVRLRQTINTLVDVFVRDYLAVNPPSP